MARLKTFLDVFTTVTTCTVIGVGVYCGIFFPGIHFGIEMMWEILLVALLTSAGTLMYKDELSKKSTKIRCVIHYLMVNVIVVVCGIWFHWFHTDDLAQVIGMLILVAIIFLGQQIVEGVAFQDNISNMAHIVGGIVGAAFGYFLNKRQKEA